MWEIVAVRYGIASLPRSRLFHHYEAYGEPDSVQDMAYFFYVLRSGARTILVDTGFRAESVAARAGRAMVVAPQEALAMLGVEPAGVERILVTHFHWDHTGNLHRFPRTELLVPEREAKFWGTAVARDAQFALHAQADDVDLLLAAHREGRARTTGADEAVAPGLRVITVGGHSPGQQVLVVDTAGGPVVLASDAVHLYEERERRRPFGVIADLRAMYEAYDRLDGFERDGAVVVPGHDPAVLERFPAVDGDAAAHAVQIAGR
jgi:glyoxylase-like metal-dependent hydrolase (beta-lactamase superfamily II)